MAMDSTEFAKLTKKKSVEESSEESAAVATMENPASEGPAQSEGGTRRRKGRTPVKNLPPVTKRLSAATATTHGSQMAIARF